MLPSEIPKLPQRPTCGRVSCCVETSPPSRLPPQNRSPSPKSFVSVFFVCLFVFVLPPFKKNGLSECLSGCLVSFTSIQKWFCGSGSTFKWALMNLWGRKWSSWPIPLPSWDCPCNVLNESISPGSHCNIFCPDCSVSFSNLYKGRGDSPYLGIQIWQ